jgi:hypothetical protein
LRQMKEHVVASEYKNTYHKQRSSTILMDTAKKVTLQVQ